MVGLASITSRLCRLASTEGALSRDKLGFVYCTCCMYICTDRHTCMHECMHGFGLIVPPFGIKLGGVTCNISVGLACPLAGKLFGA